MKSNEITLEKLQENLRAKFPDFGIHISESHNTGEMEIIEVTISIPNQAEIVFHQIKNFFDDVGCSQSNLLRKAPNVPHDYLCLPLQHF